MGERDSAGPSDRFVSIRHFFIARWLGLVPPGTLFWRDMILVATVINVATSLASLALLAAKMPLALALCLFFAPLPYNLFLAFAVWRTAGKRGGPFALGYQCAAILWLIAATIL